MADCMECEEDIDEDCDVCPGCGLDAPVSYRWYRDLYGEKVEEAKQNNDSKLLCELYFEAYVDAGMLPDPYVVGDMARELEVLYRDLKMHDRLIWLYVFDATSYDMSCLENPGRKAYLHAASIKRPDLESYVMGTFDYFNNRRTQTGTPEDLVERKKELGKMLGNEEFKHIEFPMISKTMWKEYEAQ